MIEPDPLLMRKTALWISGSEPGAAGEPPGPWRGCPTGPGDRAVLMRFLELPYGGDRRRVGMLGSHRPGAMSNRDWRKKLSRLLAQFSAPSSGTGGQSMNDLEEHGFIREVFRRAMPDDLPAAIEQRLEKRLTTFPRTI